jgi:F0F1-type ATP synthase assembly protein I
MDDKEQSGTNGYLKYTGMGVQMLGSIGLGIWGGLKLDELMGISPAMTLVCSLLGLGAALYLVVKQAMPKR